MEAIKAIFSRRSIRKFTAESIGDETIEHLLRAGCAAPSAHNEQPWHFIIIKNRAILDEIPRIHPYAQMLKQTPVALAVCADHKLSNISQVIAVGVHRVGHDLYRCLSGGSVPIGVVARQGHCVNAHGQARGHHFLAGAKLAVDVRLPRQ